MKNTILKSITVIAVLVAVICVCCIDSPNREIFETGIFISGAWVITFLGVNWDRFIRKCR